MEPDTATDLELDDAALALAEQQEDEAFAASFAEQPGDTPQGHVDPADATPAAGAPAPAPGTSPAPKPAATPAAPATAPAPAPVDPFAGLPKEVKDLLAEVPALKQRVSTAEGRFAKTRQELDDLRARVPAAAPPPPPAQPKLDAVRRELPEVADAIEEAVAARAATAPSPAPSAPAAPSDSTEGDPWRAALEEAHPDWKPTVGSADFELWLTQQAPAFAEKIRSTQNPAVMAGAITDFKGFRTRATEAQRLAAAEHGARHNRVAAAAALPTGAGARPAAPPGTLDEEEDAFQAVFKT